ncbi:hypothetical protein ABIB85_007270 [Bradyrhizobium sp. JR1.5]
MMMGHSGNHRDEGGVAFLAMRRISMSHSCNAALYSRFLVSRFSDCSWRPGF